MQHSLRAALIFLPHLRPGHPNCLFPWCFLTWYVSSLPNAVNVTALLNTILWKRQWLANNTTYETPLFIILIIPLFPPLPPLSLCYGRALILSLFFGCRDEVSRYFKVGRHSFATFCLIFKIVKYFHILSVIINDQWWKIPNFIHLA
jgi:hypothetical protein